MYALSAAERHNKQTFAVCYAQWTGLLGPYSLASLLVKQVLLLF